MTEAPTIDAEDQEQRKLDPALFKSEIERTDGTLVPLEKRSKNGKRLFVTARYIRNPVIEPDPKAAPDFYHWREDWAGRQHTGVVLVDTYAEGDDVMIPVGHMDWWLTGDYANGGGNMHRAAVPEQSHELASDARWGNTEDHIAFKVEPEYQQQGIGSLMLATSAVALPAAGVREFYSGGLLEPAKRTYARFDLNPEDFPLRPLGSAIPVERLTQSPQVDKTITEFLEE